MGSGILEWVDRPRTENTLFETRRMSEHPNRSGTPGRFGTGPGVSERLAFWDGRRRFDTAGVSRRADAGRKAGVSEWANPRRNARLSRNDFGLLARLRSAPGRHAGVLAREVFWNGFWRLGMVWVGLGREWAARSGGKGGLGRESAA